MTEVARDKASRIPLELLREKSPSPAALSRAGFSTVEEMYDAVAVRFRLPRLHLDSVEPGLETIALIPAEMAAKHKICPVFVTPDELTIAASDPTQLSVFDWIGRQHKRTISIVIATPAEIERAQRRLYETKRAATIETDDDIAVSKEDLAAASGLVNAFIAGAIDQKASDIHIEAHEGETIIRYRVDGALRQVDRRPLEMHPAIVSRIKVMANLDIAIRHAPQDGRIKLPSAAGIDLRVSVLPTYWGEKVVCRLLDNRRAMLPLDAIGFDAEQKAEFLSMVQASYGLVLVTGPTGSGKSTTLYAALNAIRDPEVNVVSVEDPVEYQIGGVNQVQVAPKRGLTFASSLRSILRQDPDVILVGETRDQETGQLAAEAALTGHLVLTSLHTNDALSSITRLLELGVERYLVAPSLVGIVAQRLLRSICKQCKQDYAPPATELQAVGIPNVPAGTLVSRGRGCSACHNTGYSGRVAVREILTIDDKLRMLIARAAPIDEMRAAALAAGFKTMRFHALRLWLSGVTTTRELIRATRS